MSWSQFHERNAFLTALIERAGVDADAALDFGPGEFADLQRLFGSEENLLLALRHRWITLLTAKMDQAVDDDVSAEQVRIRLAEAHPGLRALLDAGARRSLRLRWLERSEGRIAEYFDGPAPLRRNVVA